MAPLLYDRLNLRELPTGRRVFAARQVERVAQDLGADAVAEAARAVVVHDTQTLEYEARWNEARGHSSRARGQARQVDAAADALIGGMYQVAQGQLTSPDETTAEAAASYLEAVHPLGLAAATNQRFEDQLGWMRTMLERFGGPLSDAVDTLRLDTHVTRLGELADELEVELSKSEDTIAFDTVRQARKAGHELLATLVFQILSTYPDDADTRGRLMAEIDRQNNLVGQAYRESGHPDDVDPDTGQPLSDEAPDPDGEAQPEPTAG